MTYYIAQGTLLSVMWQPGWEGSLRENGYVCMYDESLHCSPETITALLYFVYTPTQNKKFKNTYIYFKNFIKYRVLISMTSEFLQQGLGIWLNMKTHWLKKICWARSESLYSVWLRQQRIYPQCGRPGFDPWVGKIPWRREWLPTPVLLPGEFHGQRTLAGYSPWGHKEWNTTDQLTLSLSLHVRS